MLRAPRPEERALIDRLERAVGRAVEVLPGFAATCFAHMRVQNGGSAPLELFLGNQTLLRDEVSVIDWRRAPLAAVFFGTRGGERYEIEAEGRVLEGLLLDRSLLRFSGDALAGVELPRVRLARHGSEWQAQELEDNPILTAGGEARASPFAVDLDPVQRRAVELPAGRTLLVLGEAGFGKTTVAMHRLAHLTRSAKSERALVLVPTEGLRRLCELVLERLDAQRVQVETFDAWVATQARKLFARLPDRTSEETSVATIRLKRHPALRDTLSRFAKEPRKAGGRPPKTTIREDLLSLFGDRDLLTRVVEASDGQIPTAAVRQTAEHTRVQFSKTTEQQYKGVSEEFLATVDGLAIDAGTPMHDAQTIDAEDFPVLFALNHLRAGRDKTRRGSLSRYHHVVVDEAQELAPIEIELVGRALAKGGTLTVSGDENQQVDDTAYFASWNATMAELGAGADFERIVLKESYRCPPAITQFARRLRAGEGNKGQSEGWPRVGEGRESARTNPLLLSLYDNECHLCSAVIEELSRLVDADASAKVAVVCRNAATARQTEENLSRGLHTKLGLDGDFDFEPGVVVTCVSEVKGLEFDYVVVPDASAAVYPDKPEARRALYVAVTRAIRQLWLVASAEWSPLLWPAGSFHRQATAPLVLAPQA